MDEEVIGFWIAVVGMLLFLSSGMRSTKLSYWVEEKVFIPWYVQICIPTVGVLLILVGWHIWCLGNAGRYPGYPLDQWMRTTEHLAQ